MWENDSMLPWYVISIVDGKTLKYVTNSNYSNESIYPTTFDEYNSSIFVEEE